MASLKARASLKLNFLHFRMKGIKAFCGNVNSLCREFHDNAPRIRDMQITRDLDRVCAATKQLQDALEVLRLAIVDFRKSLNRNIDRSKRLGTGE